MPKPRSLQDQFKIEDVEDVEIVQAKKRKSDEFNDAVMLDKRSKPSKHGSVQDQFVIEEMSEDGIMDLQINITSTPKISKQIKRVRFQVFGPTKKSKRTKRVSPQDEFEIEETEIVQPKKRKTDKFNGAVMLDKKIKAIEVPMTEVKPEIEKNASKKKGIISPYKNLDYIPLSDFEETMVASPQTPNLSEVKSKKVSVKPRDAVPMTEVKPDQIEKNTQSKKKGIISPYKNLDYIPLSDFEETMVASPQTPNLSEVKSKKVSVKPRDAVPMTEVKPDQIEKNVQSKKKGIISPYKNLDYIPLSDFEETMVASPQTPNLSEVKSKKPVSVKPRDTEKAKLPLPSLNNGGKSQQQLYFDRISPKDFKNKMLFDPSRIKRIDGKKILQLKAMAMFKRN